MKTEGRKITTSIDINAHFTRPVGLAPVYCEAEVTQMGRTIAYIEGKLSDEKDRLCERCVSSAMIMKFPKPE